MAVAHHWKHGWVPLDGHAALQKAKGDKSAAAKMLGDVHTAGGTHGIKDRKGLAEAIKAVPDIPEAYHREDAKYAVKEAASKLGAHDLIPHGWPGHIPPGTSISKVGPDYHAHHADGGTSVHSTEDAATNHLRRRNPETPDAKPTFYNGASNGQLKDLANDPHAHPELQSGAQAELERRRKQQANDHGPQMDRNGNHLPSHAQDDAAKHTDPASKAVERRAKNNGGQKLPTVAEDMHGAPRVVKMHNNNGSVTHVSHIEAADHMHGTGSAQHLKAIRDYGVPETYKVQPEAGGKFKVVDGYGVTLTQGLPSAKAAATFARKHYNKAAAAGSPRR